MQHTRVHIHARTHTQALGKLKVTLVAGGSKNARGSNAGGFDLLSSAGASGDSSQQGLLTWEGRVPEDVAQVCVYV
jgi:hypothetical protein